jgi:hypothetical protein
MMKFVLSAAVLLAGNALATPITGASTSGPVVPGMTEKTGFESQPVAGFSSVTIGNVTFTGVGGNLETTYLFTGSYNTTGTRLLDNNAGSTNAFRFDFTNPVSAFAFNFGASDYNWTLSAYAASGALLESLTIAPTHSTNNGSYFGLADAGISYALLTASQSDYVMLDNFTFAKQAPAVVPEPAPLTLLGAGLACVAAARRRKAKHSA